MTSTQQDISLVMWEATLRGYQTGNKPKGWELAEDFLNHWPFTLDDKALIGFRLIMVPKFLEAKQENYFVEALPESVAPHWFDYSYEDWSKSKGTASNHPLIRNAVLTSLEASLEKAFEVSLLHTIVTHFHPETVVATALHTWLLRELIEGRSPFSAHDDQWLRRWHQAWVTWLFDSDDIYVRAWLGRVHHEYYPACSPFESAVDLVTRGNWFLSEQNPFEKSSNPQGPVQVLQRAVWCVDAVSLNEHQVVKIDTHGQLPDEVMRCALAGRGYELAALLPGDASVCACLAATLTAAGWGWSAKPSSHCKMYEEVRKLIQERGV